MRDSIFGAARRSPFSTIRDRFGARCAVFLCRAVIPVVLIRPVGAQPVAAVGPHDVRGSVRAVDESRIIGARVDLRVARPSGEWHADAATDNDGRFRFNNVPDGEARVVIRRLGFRPETLTIEVPQPPGGPTVVLLETVAQPLAPVLVRNTRRVSRLPSGFDRRRASGFGHYISRLEIERRNPQRTSELLRGLPGVTVGSEGPHFRAVGGAQTCEPAYVLDGMPVGSGTFDLDAISPKAIEAVEVYNGAATVPPALRSSAMPGGCGLIALWTRQGDTPRDPLNAGVPIDSLDAMVAHGSAYTADQVELAASPLPGFAPAPTYPESLRGAGIRGRVIAEFIVDPQGNVDPATIGIVSSTNPLFADAVRAALLDARFSPAYREGHVVRQVVQLPVVFEPGVPSAGPIRARSSPPGPE